MKPLTAFVTFVAAITLTGCASTMTVSSHVESGIDFGRYQTFDWGPADELPAGDPRLDRNPFFKDHLQGAIEKEMTLHGIRLADRGTAPDLRIHYHASVNRRLSVNGVDRKLGDCAGANCLAEVTEYDAGTLVLDIVDARTNRVVWRGWSQDTVEGVIGDNKKMERQIDEAVPRMLARLPKAF
jgi:hypothetical protein